MNLVAGLGITGQSVLRYFKSQQEPCLAFDTRQDYDLSALKEQFPEVQFAQGEVPTEWLTKFDNVILSPGISKREPWVVSLKKLGKQIIGDIELFARAVGKPVVGITGSNGKSTVTTITGRALQQAGYSVGVGGNIGQPALDLLIDDHDYDVFVLELSSFQLETTYSLTTASATILNISEDHMDRYVGIEDYIQAKTKVFAQADLAVIPAGLGEKGLIHHEKIAHFCTSPESIKADYDYGVMHHQGEPWLGYGKTPVIPASCMKLQGKHHQLNALAMMALCRPFDVAAEHFAYVLENFAGLPHRTELVLVHNGVTWINDSKGTNVGATLTALMSLGDQIPGKIILLAGGVSKDADFKALQAPILDYCREVILFGRDQQQIADDLEIEQLNTDVQLQQVDDLATAVGLALESAQPEDCVLFSPACASFDQFNNYMHRGDSFADLVEQACGVSSGVNNGVSEG